MDSPTQTEIVMSSTSRPTPTPEHQGDSYASNQAQVPSDVAAPFTWSADEIRRVGHRVAELIASHLAELPAGPVFRPVPSSLAEALVSAPLPRVGEPVDEILSRFAADVAPYPFGNGHPRFYGWVNSPPAVIGVFAEALAAAMNPSVAGGNHAAVWIERQVIGWFRQLLGFPRESMGLLVSGGSAAAITALAVARQIACARRGWNARVDGVRGTAADARSTQLLVYKSAEGHSCNQKAVELLGLGSASLREVPTDAALRMRPEALDAMLAEDLAAGCVPVAVVASAGTVNTGAIDPLASLADVCTRHRVWLHVDGAYGAPAILSGKFRDELAAIAHAMRDTFSLVPPYLRTDGNVEGVQGPPWFSEYGAEQTRPFRALKVWMALRYFGLEGYRALVEHDLALARHLAARVHDTEGVKLWEPQGLSVVCFRATPPELRGDVEALDALNRAVLLDVQLGGKGFLTSTVLGGRVWLRACFVNPRASTADVDAVFDAVLEAVGVAVAARARRLPEVRA
jgi:aromatic-L-amino-acid/L-tryptophan decarboxylase